MLRYPKNLGGLDTIVNYSASLIRIPVCDIIVHLPSNYYVHVLATHRRLYYYSASLVSIIIHVYAVNLRVILRWVLRKTWRMRKRCVPGPFSSSSKGLGTRLPDNPIWMSNEYRSQGKDIDKCFLVKGGIYVLSPCKVQWWRVQWWQGWCPSANL